MYEVNTTQCSGCGTCIEICPSDAIFMVDNKARIDETKCRECRKCLDVCPDRAIAVTYGSQFESTPTYVKKSNTEVIQSKTNDKVNRKERIFSQVLDFLNRMIIPRNEWSQKDILRENQSQYVKQGMKTHMIRSRGIYRHRCGRGSGRRLGARGLG